MSNGKSCKLRVRPFYARLWDQHPGNEHNVLAIVTESRDADGFNRE